MKWFKHESSDRNKVESKLIRARFGSEGYGIYQMLLEVISENIEAHNIDDWGHVNSMHDKNTLADECGVTREKLEEFLAFCDERGIFQKHKKRLYSPLILNRLDEFAMKVKKGVRVSPDSLPTDSRLTPARIEQNRIEQNKEDGIPFDTFGIFMTKVGRPKSEAKWKKLSRKDQQAIIDYIPRYKEATPDKKYRKNPETFLNNRSWEDEILGSSQSATPLIKRDSEAEERIKATLEKRGGASEFAQSLLPKMKIDREHSSV